MKLKTGLSCGSAIILYRVATVLQPMTSLQAATTEVASCNMQYAYYTIGAYRA